MIPFACIHCMGETAQDAAGLRCQGCGRTYPVRDGVPDFLPDPGLLQRLGLDPAGLDTSVAAYDVIHGEDLFNSSAEMRDAAALAGAKAGQRILDVGCGTGQMFDYLPEDALVAGLDISPAALRAAGARRPGAQMVRGIGERLPFPDASFDLLFCMGSLEHFFSMEQGLQEFRRVLAPGGQAIILLPQKFFLLKNALYYYVYPHFRPVRLVQRALLRFRRFRRMHVQHQDHHFTREELLALLAASGLRIEKCLDIPTDAALWRTFDFLARLSKPAGD